MEAQEPHNKLSREQKVGVTLLFVFSLLTVGLAFLQMRNNVVSPFVFRGKTDASTKSLQDFQVELQNIDTDNDGLTDFDEVQFHNTSAFLPDTDSDGVNDKAEIDAGTDPLCAEGKFCESSTAQGKTIAPSLGNPVTTPLQALSQSLPKEGQVSTDDQKALDALMNNPDQIRELLRQTGQVPEDQLNSLDDATLLKILQDILNAQKQVSKEQTGPSESKQSLPPVNSSSTLNATSTEEGT